MSLSSKRLFQGDLVIWAIYFWLCMISLIEVYSAGSSLSYKSGDFMAPLFKQAIFLGIGTAVVWVIHSIPCRFFSSCWRAFGCFLSVPQRPKKDIIGTATLL